MRHATEEAESPDRAEDAAESPEDDPLAAVKPAGEPLGVSLTELLVRQTLSDLENRLTADHHLKGADSPGDKETESSVDEDPRVT